ncbi:MAG: protein-export chaperone SecB [Formosimonas sp.]
MTEQAQPTFDLRRVYMKDASLELPNAPAIFLEEAAPQVAIEVSTENRALDTDAYEVQVNVNLTARLNDKVFFILEIKQAAIFEITNMPEEQLGPILNIICPSMIYPYLRANVSDLLTRATLPPLHLTEVNFEQFYQDKLENSAATVQ